MLCSKAEYARKWGYIIKPLKTVLRALWVVSHHKEIVDFFKILYYNYDLYIEHQQKQVLVFE